MDSINSFFDFAHETMPVTTLRALQLQRLKCVCARVYANVPFYRRKFDSCGVKPDDICTMDDIRRLPFTEKQDMRDNYPYGLFATPMDEIVRVHCSSGTTGRATVVGYTQGDLEIWATCVARGLAMSGAKKDDILHVAFGYGLFTGGLGLHDGGQKLGMTVIPASGGATRRQAHLIKDFGATVLACTPSYSLHLYEAAMDEGIDFKDMPLRIGIFGAEPWTDAMRRDIEAKMGIKATNIYGLSEIMGPGVAVECATAQNGMHLNEDHFFAEIINPDTGEQMPAGEEGELVLTTLTKEGLPLIRYRTHDITSLNYEPCECGRTFVRINRFKGRSDEMLIIRGVNFFPSQVESLLLDIPGVAPHYQIIVERKENLDTVEILVEVNESLFSDVVRDLQNLERKIEHLIKEYLGITTRIRLVGPNSIPRSEGKTRRVIDKRMDV